MRNLRRIVRVAHAWLTVAALVVASAPHFRCVCPDGRVKPFCLAISSGPSGCCCGGSCCPSKEGGSCCCQSRSDPVDEEAGASCCCQAKSERPSPVPPGEFQARRCTKTPATGDFLGVAPDRQAGADGLVGGYDMPALPDASAVASTPPFVARLLSWQSHQLPPPDLVIVLLHLLI
jgi:hypothetical protein